MEENRREFCKKFNLNRGNVYQVLTGKKKSVKGWSFEWID
ncbi:hypothetical protein [Anoxybacillus flavithermus]